MGGGQNCRRNLMNLDNSASKIHRAMDFIAVLVFERIMFNSVTNEIQPLKTDA